MLRRNINGEDIAALRGLYVEEALWVGSVPVPATGKGVTETVVGKLKGKNPEVLFDKLGQRAAYERSGVRLYQAMSGMFVSDEVVKASMASYAFEHIEIASHRAPMRRPPAL